MCIIEILYKYGGLSFSKQLRKRILYKQILPSILSKHVRIELLELRSIRINLMQDEVDEERQEI